MLRIFENWSIFLLKSEARVPIVKLSGGDKGVDSKAPDTSSCMFHLVMRFEELFGRLIFRRKQII